MKLFSVLSRAQRLKMWENMRYRICKWDVEKTMENNLINQNDDEDSLVNIDWR